MKTRGISVREASSGLIVLLVNAVVMSVELLATRLLFPRYGNTIFTWSAVITIVITGLFAGYWAGGVLADRRQDRFALLSLELTAAAVFVLAVPFLCDWVLLKIPLGDALYPPLWGCFLVFGLPAACLASAPPAVVGIVAGEGRSAAAASGIVSALSALGSVGGTLATTFWLVPSYGVRGLFIGYGVGLFALALFSRLFAAGKLKPARALAAVLAFLAGLAAGSQATAHPALTTLVEPVFRKESQYQLVRVFEHGGGRDLTRLLMLDSTEEGAMKVQSSDVVFDYTRAYRVFTNAFSAKDERKILFIGGGAYGMPVRTAELLPKSEVDVAELDPVVEDVARRYFKAGDVPNLKMILADGRRAAAERPGRYDGIFVDAYQGVYAIPFHLATRQFFETLRGALKPQGFVAFNVIGSIAEREGFLCSFAETLRQVFPRVDLYPVRGIDETSQNIILVAGPKKGFPFDRDLMKGAQFPVRVTSDGLACSGKTMILTDDHAPVEWLVAQYLARER